MKPLICPQCGGKILNYSHWDSFATCGYCGTKFLIEKEKENTSDSYPESEISYPSSSASFINILIGAIVVIIFAFGALMLFGVARKGKPANPTYPVSTTSFPSPSPRISPTPPPNPNLLEFGGKGTGNGLFQEADSIAVDSKGRIYVADETLRVQQFDRQGKFLKLWQIPSETAFYKRARTIQKIAVDDRERLHVLVGGVVFIYENGSSEPLKAVYFSPDAILDFALRADGSRLYVVTDDEIETLYHISEKGKTLKKLEGFHSETADASLQPYTTGLAAIRIAVDGAGNIFSVYAFGDLGTYQLSYNAEELMIFRFTPEGRFVNKFVQTMNSCGIEVDNQSRIYISDRYSISTYTNRGERVSIIPDLNGVDAFALDKENNVYILHDDKVIKRPAIQ